MEHSPTLYVEAVVLSCLYQPCLKKFPTFPSASLEHNASSAERILSALAAKLQQLFGMTKFLRVLFRKKRGWKGLEKKKNDFWPKDLTPNIHSSQLIHHKAFNSPIMGSDT